MAGKRGRPSKPKESMNETQCLEYYQMWKSAAFTATKLKLNRHTVEKYFEKFRQKEVEEKNDQFVQRQRMAKNLCIGKLDEMIEHLEQQIGRYSNLMTGEGLDITPDGQRVESQYTKSVAELSTLYQQKADIEMTATMDVKVDELVREKYEEFSSNKES